MPDKAEHNEYDINLKDCDININLSVDIFYDITFFWNFKIPCIITNNMNLISSKIFKPLTVFHFVDDFLCICSENICCVIHIEQFDFSFFENRKETVFLPLDKNDIYFIRKYVNKINIVSEYEIEIVAEDVTQILNYFKELSHTNEDLKSGNISKNQSNTQNEENQSNNETIQVNHFEKSSDNTENKLASENYINASENPSNNFFLHFDEISQKNFSIQHNIKLATFIKLIIHIVASFFIYRHSFPRSSFYKKSFFHSTKFKNTFQEFYRHNFIYLHVLGNGANSFNCLVVHKETGDFFSLKSFYNKKSYLREKKIYQMVNHKCVLKCYGFIKPTIHSANKNFAIVLDNCAHGNLRKFIKTHSLNNTEKTKILLQVLFGLDHLHSKGIIHRDIKIDNILLNENYDAILSDFDISRSYDNNRAFTTNVGTFRYMAPEQIIHQNISFQTDLYSFGLMIYQIATNKEPYEKLTLLQMVDKISQGNVPKISQTIYGKIIEIYRMCTSLNIEKRVGSFYILRQMISHELYFLNTDSNFIHKKVIEKLEDYKDKYIISSEKLSLNNSNSFEFNSNKQEFNPRINTENELANNAVFDGTTSSINQNDKSQINKDSIKLKNLKKTTSKENNNDESPSDVRKDVQFIIDMAENGHTTSQFYLGLIYLQGTELQQDQQKAFKLLKMAADKGHAIAAYNIAISYEKSNNLNEAIKYYKMAANGKFPNAFYALSRLSQDPEEVIFYLKQACELNFTKALYSLGVHYSRTEKDYVKAFEYFHKAADLGDADAMEKVGEYLGHGKGTEMNQKKSFEMFKIAAEQGNVDAMYNLGVCYKEGRGCLVNKNKSSECFEKAAKRGHVKSIYNYGLLCGDKTRAFECFKKAALKGHSTAQYKVGMCYELGIGTSSNLDKALKYYQKSAAANNDFGMLSLGRFYEKYCAHNKAKKKQIFHLYEKSAKQGNHQAMYNLALCYEKKRDQENMIFWLKSASVSSPDAQFRLGVMYLKGKYVERNECSAYEYFSQASSHGHPKSQFYLGLCFEFGKGTEKNLQKSLELYRKSAEKGIPEANFKIGLMYEFELHQHVLHGHSVDNKCEKCKHSDKRIGQISDANSDASSDKNTENVKKAVYYYQRAAKIDNRYLFHVYRITNNIKKLEELLSDKKLVSLAPSIQLFIGEYYLHKNNPTCISFLLEAANKKNIKSSLILGELYENGKFVEKSKDLSIKYYQSSAAFGHKKAIEKLNSKKSNLCNCCINEIKGNSNDRVIKKRAFECLTCSLVEPCLICCYCAMSCHEGHAIIDNGISTSFHCDCTLSHK